MFVKSESSISEYCRRTMCVRATLTAKLVTRGLMAFLAATSVTAGAQNPIGAGPAPGGDYEIGPEDLLEISVWKEKDLQKEVLVRPDGWVSFPLVGDIQVHRKTAKQVEDEIRERLRKYIPDPVVNVSVKKIAGYKIFVIGKVNKQGEYVVGQYVDVVQALSLAGGLTPFADESGIRIIRKENANGPETVFRFDYSDVKKGRALDQNIKLKSGDVIIVP
jgi:polysaccharide export outer membrane protein